MSPPYLYPAPPPSSPTVETLTNSSFFSTLPSWSGRDPHSQGDHLSGLEVDEGGDDDRMEEDSFPTSTLNSPPLVPFALSPRTTTSTSSSSACPPSPPLIALSLSNNFSSNPSSPSSSSSSNSPPRPTRPVAHPLHSTSKLRLEMTPLPTFQLPLADTEMSPPWSMSDLAGPPPSHKPRKNSLVSLPVAPPTPPLTPNEELPSFNWGNEITSHRGRPTEVTPLVKRRRYN
ncbi:hypothetical protein JCM5350_006762 [Sporobolomyces pararoseus]